MHINLLHDSLINIKHMGNYNNNNDNNNNTENKFIGIKRVVQ